MMTSGLLGPTELVISDQNMVAISNPCKLDPDLAPPGILLLHAYGCGNEPYERWEGMPRGGAEYERLKRERAEVLWQAVERVIPDARRRVKVSEGGEGRFGCCVRGWQAVEKVLSDAKSRVFEGGWGSPHLRPQPTRAVSPPTHLPR